MFLRFRQKRIDDGPPERPCRFHEHEWTGPVENGQRYLEYCDRCGTKHPAYIRLSAKTVYSYAFLNGHIDQETAQRGLETGYGPLTGEPRESFKRSPESELPIRVDAETRRHLNL